MKRSLELISQLIVIAEEKDRLWRELHRKLNKSSQSIGEDAITFHLRRLKELLEEESKPTFQIPSDTCVSLPLVLTGTYPAASNQVYDRPVVSGLTYPTYFGT